MDSSVTDNNTYEDEDLFSIHSAEKVAEEWLVSMLHDPSRPMLTQLL